MRLLNLHNRGDDRFGPVGLRSSGSNSVLALVLLRGDAGGGAILPRKVNTSFCSNCVWPSRFRAGLPGRDLKEVLRGGRIRPVMFSCRLSFALPALLGLAMLACGQAGAALTFEKDVRPILKAHCFQCHGEDGVTKGNLDARLARYLIKGGKEGPAVVPGKAAESPMIEMVTKGEMPKGKAALKPTEIATLTAWVNEGAKTARPEPEKLGPEHAFTDEERAWWAFQPIAHPSPPAVEDAKVVVRNPIDLFVAAKLKDSGLEQSVEADAQTFIRRATFDLTGLPPTPEEVEAYVAASIRNQELAVKELLDRLLDSPAYGERWGRHWLDVAGYADSDGYTDRDLERKYAFKYRDYVVKAFNTDKPFDQFVREQIAGDEMVQQPHKNLSQDAIEKLTATGFLRMAPDGTGAMNDAVVRNSAIADTIKIIGTSLYGMTVGCAQCHDHRYDPITQVDYYRLRAIFEPGFDTKNWRVPTGRLVSLLTDADKTVAAKIEAEAKKVDDARLVKLEAFIDEVLEKELQKRKAEVREDLRRAYKTVAAKRTPAQLKLLKDNPSVDKLTSGSLYLYDTTYGTKHAAELKKMTDEATAIRAKKPVEEFVHAFEEQVKTPATIPATFVFNRGDPEQPKQQVKPGELTILAGHRQVEFPEKATTSATTGRRLAFANSLTDGKHPLLARVMVNRVWAHHFGKGIVPSVGDFGTLGQKPSHPELLDWLSTEFMAKGWSIKNLHRLIMTSATYRQSSKRNSGRERIDPDNRLLSRQNVRRLEAEVLRDSFLAVGSKLNTKVSGTPVPVAYDEQGQVVIGIDTADTAGRQTGKYIPLNGEEFRRSLYVQVRRTKPYEMFTTFDGPTMEPNCTDRNVTTVSPQSLLLMNNTYMREFASYFATRLQADCGSDVRKQVERAWLLSYGHGASMAEVEEAVTFVQAQTDHYKKSPTAFDVSIGPASTKPAAPETLGLAALCHALLSSNEFLYVD